MQGKRRHRDELVVKQSLFAGKAGLFSWLRGTSGSTAGKLSISETIAVPQLKAIKTSHEHDVAISHPELASPFSPSDIAIWEVNTGEATRFA